VIATGLRRPVSVATLPDGTEQDPLFVVAQHDAAVWVVGSNGVIRPEPFLQIFDDVDSAMEQGLLAMVFHPSFPTDPRVFITYARFDDNLVLEEWRVSDDGTVADPETRRVLLDIPHTSDFHYGAHLAFGPDGFLYVASGDGGPQFDRDGHAQNLDSLRGKVLRIDVDTAEAGPPYGIPDGNPFIGMGRPEVFAYGLRNPWSFGFAASGHLFIADVGFDSSEELDVIPGGSNGGQNFGWPILEGATECIEPTECDTTGLTAPIHEYLHQDGCAISGVVAYDGCSMPGHRGKVFFTDFCSGWVRSLVYSASPPGIAFLTEWPMLLQTEQLSKLVTGANGEMLLLGYQTGTIWKIVPAPAN
jgi:glucose/arabinose dehydrogenase